MRAVRTDPGAPDRVYVIVLIRHGQTEANARNLLQGRADLPLTELGRAQAEARRRSIPVGARFVSSPLLRARQTAEILAAGRPVDLDPRWIELDYGRWDQRPLAEVPEELWARWRSDVHYRPPEGESLAECAERVAAACVELAARAEDVVVISHVSPIKAAVAWALGVGVEVSWRMFLEVGGVCRITLGPSGPSLRSYNEIA